MAGENFLAEAWAELAIAICVIGLRLYYRITQVGIRKLGLDDYLMVCAGVSFLSVIRSTSSFTNRLIDNLHLRDNGCAFCGRMARASQQQHHSRGPRDPRSQLHRVEVPRQWLQDPYRWMVHIHGTLLGAEMLLDNLLLPHDVRKPQVGCATSSAD
jgi:hypothetical protein